jgi:hypothetical protein
METVVSFDPGIKNLAFCILKINLETGKVYISDWDNVKLLDDRVKTISYDKLTQSIYDFLVPKFDDMEIDYVVIENQPAIKNPKMKNVQMTVYNYFTMKNYRNGKSLSSVNFISASCKLKICKEMGIEIKGGSKYSKNKKKSIEAVTRILTSVENSQEPDEVYNLEYFCKHKKKDDLSDTLLQGLFFIKNVLK